MSQSAPLYPLVFKPVYKDYVWGGNRIPLRYGRPVPPGIYAESWEITDRPEGMSVVVNGSLAGKDLHELVQTYPQELLGANRTDAVFPLLVKLIDSRERLSVQVHPDEARASRIGGEPKTEMWYVLEADPGAAVFAGFKTPVTVKEFRAALKNHTMPELLNRVPVNKGDVIAVPGGRVHAIDAGCLLLEVQQNSDTTYRLYDWGRVDAAGQARPLHLKKAGKVINWKDTGPVKLPLAPVDLMPDRLGNAVVERWRAPYFGFEQIALVGALAGATGRRTFHILFVEAGTVRIRTGGASGEFTPGTTVLIPAALDEYELQASDAGVRLLRISLP